MNKKGFTLVELLAIIAILGIIVAIAAPNINKQIAKGEEETKNILNQKIENASKLYAAKYYSEKMVDLPTCVNDCTISFTLEDLEEDGLIDLNDKCTGKTNENIEISYNSSIEYNYDAIETNDCYWK